MLNWNVEPLNDVNGIKFGMDRTTVRKVIASEVTAFKKTKFSKTTTDDFGFCHVFYDIDDKCEAVEIFDDVTVTVHGTLVFPTSMAAVKTVFTDIEEDSDGCISKKDSIGIYAPSGKMESILFGDKGYYE